MSQRLQNSPGVTPLRASRSSLRTGRQLAASAAVLSLSATLGLAAPALAHDQAYPIAADEVVVRTDLGPGSELFEFKSSDAEGLPLPRDPASTGSALLIVGHGDNGGRSPLMALDSSKWSPGEPDSYLYTNQDADRPGGVTNLLVSGTLLEIDASGENWSFDPAGPLDSLSVHFRIEDEWYCAQFSDESATVDSNVAGHFAASFAAPPGFGACDVPVCGNGEREIDEECDDGNLENDDSCENDCTLGLCTVDTPFSTTFEGIRKLIFEEPQYNCPACHGAVNPLGGFSLVPLNEGTSDAEKLAANAEVYQNLLGADGLGIQAMANNALKLVELSEPALSVLYLKLLKKRLEGLDPGYLGPAVGSGMPTSGQRLSEAHTEAIRKWIRAGAPLDKTVEGTAELLGTCLPPPDPLKIAVPAPPAAGDGFQLQQPPWELDALAEDSNGEDEVCLATYFDLSDLVPPESVVNCPDYLAFRKGCEDDPNKVCESDGDCAGENTCVVVKNAVNEGNQCVTWNHQTLLQDAQSHHSIIQLYIGRADTSDAGWGSWTFKLEPTDPDYDSKHGLPCSPLDIDSEGGLAFNPGCSSEIVSGVACAGFGPSDYSEFGVVGGPNQTGLSGSQEPYYDQELESGVFSYMPMRGIVSWNSHAFNLTDSNSTMAQYLNIEVAKGEAEQQHQAQGIFYDRWIFVPYVPAFQTQQICATYTLPQDAKLFQLSSHTHVFGTKFRIWAPPNERCQPGCPIYLFADGGNGDLATFRLTHPLVNLCVNDANLPLCEGPREDEPLYYSTEYSDPLQLEFSPPISHASSDPEDRTYLYCSYYDNGSSPQSPPTKLQSQSPPTPDLGLGTLIQGFVGPALGGPCEANIVRCDGGDNHGELCGDSTRPHVDSCGDGVCDACPVHGGVTTADEMFILIGGYYVEGFGAPVPEPSSTALSVGALVALALLARRRRSPYARCSTRRLRTPACTGFGESQ